MKIIVLKMKDENLQLREKLSVDQKKYQKWNPQAVTSSKMSFVCCSDALIPDYGLMFVGNRGVFCCQSASDRTARTISMIMTSLHHNNIVYQKPLCARADVSTILAHVNELRGLLLSLREIVTMLRPHIAES